MLDPEKKIPPSEVPRLPAWDPRKQVLPLLERAEDALRDTRNTRDECHSPNEFRRLFQSATSACATSRQFLERGNLLPPELARENFAPMNEKFSDFACQDIRLWQRFCWLEGRLAEGRADLPAALAAYKTGDTLAWTAANPDVLIYRDTVLRRVLVMEALQEPWEAAAESLRDLAHRMCQLTSSPLGVLPVRRTLGRIYEAVGDDYGAYVQYEAGLSRLTTHDCNDIYVRVTIEEAVNLAEKLGKTRRAAALRALGDKSEAKEIPADRLLPPSEALKEWETFLKQAEKALLNEDFAGAVSCYEDAIEALKKEQGWTLAKQYRAFLDQGNAYILWAADLPRDFEARRQFLLGRAQDVTQIVTEALEKFDKPGGLLLRAYQNLHAIEVARPNEMSATLALKRSYAAIEEFLKLAD